MLLTVWIARLRIHIQYVEILNINACACPNNFCPLSAEIAIRCEFC